MQCGFNSFIIMSGVLIKQNVWSVDSLVYVYCRDFVTPACSQR
jgi:hypothetical protein